MTLQQIDAQFVGSLRTAFAAQLPEFLPKQRWFGSKARRIQSVQLSECIPMQLPRSAAVIAFARVEFAEGPGETYVLPLLSPPPGGAIAPDTAVVRLPVADPVSELPLTDALGDKQFLLAVLSSILNSDSLAGEAGTLYAVPELALQELKIRSSESVPPRLLKVEQSNTSIVYGDRLILKFFRRVEEGINPDLEVGHFLTAVAHYANVPPLLGSLKYESRESKTSTLGLLQGFVPNQGDAWRFTVESLAGLLVALDHRAETRHSGSKLQSGANLADELPKDSSEQLGRQLQLIALLGRRTAEMHLALASSSSDPDFAPEPFTPEVREAIDSSVHDLAVRNFQMLRSKLPELPESTSEPAKHVLKLEDVALLVLHSVVEKEISSVRTRIHGDYHLGQVLFTGSDFFIIDFEGEPARPLSERRNKRSPLQDVAGMLRSFHYAARAAILAAKERLAMSAQSEARVARFAGRWQEAASAEFLRSYRNTAGDARFLPADSSEFDALLRFHLLEKAIYELGYELNNRPAWLPIPLGGIREILAART